MKQSRNSEYLQGAIGALKAEFKCEIEVEGSEVVNDSDGIRVRVWGYKSCGMFFSYDVEVIVDDEEDEIYYQCFDCTDPDAN